MINDVTGLPVHADGLLRIAPFAALPAAVSSCGASFAPILAEAGLAPQAFDDSETRIGVLQAGRLLALSAQRTACPHIGLLAGRGLGLATLGRIGELARGARDVAAALRGLIVALHMHDRVTVPTLSVRGGTASLSTVAIGDLRDGAAEIADLTMCACFNILRELCGAGWKPLAVRLARRPPPSRRPYIVAFGPTLGFDAEYNTLSFDQSWLRRPVNPQAQARPDPLARMADRHPLDAPAQVRRACVQAVIEGMPTVERLASLMGLSRRTLNRRLALNGTTARTELVRVRMGIARQLLAGTDLPLAEIADLLGYGDPSAFTRAFRGELDNAPSTWRLRRQATS